MKRFLSVLLLVVMLFSITITALASSRTTTANVNMRKGPGQTCRRITTVPKGKTLEILDSDTDSKGNTWYQVKYNGKTGWIIGKYTKSGSSSSSKVKATSGDSYIRSKPNKSSSKLTVLPKGKSATYLGEKSTDSRGVVWYKVKYNGKTGWVSSRYTKLQ